MRLSPTTTRLGAALLLSSAALPAHAQAPAAPAATQPAAPAPGQPAAPGAPSKPAPTTGAPEAATPSAEVRVLSIDAAVQEALRRNPSLEATAAAVRRAEGVLAEARSLLLPRLDGSARFAVQGPIPSFTFVQQPTTPGGRPTRTELSFGKTFTRNFRVGASYNADPFGRIRDNKVIARHAIEAARGDLYTAQNELVFAVQNLYLAALRANELQGVSQEAVELAEEQLRVATAQFRAGLAPEFDVIRARVQVANNRQYQTASDASYRRGIAALGEVLSLPADQAIQLTAIGLPAESGATALDTARQVLSPTGTDDSTAPVPQTLEAALSEAFTRRPETMRAEWNRRIAERRLIQERKGLLPSIALATGFNYDPDLQGFAVETKTWSIVANITIPIWDAGLTRARKQQARADIDAAKADERGARDAVTEEVKRALNDFEEASRRRETAAANTLQAREALRIAQVRYTAGLAQNVEVTDAQVALTQARSNEVNAAYDYLAALSSLNRALGRYAGETLSGLAK